VPIIEKQIVRDQVRVMPIAERGQMNQPARCERIIGVQYRDPFAARDPNPLIPRDRRATIGLA
jgi:hypothetical protein